MCLTVVNHPAYSHNCAQYSVPIKLMLGVFGSQLDSLAHIQLHLTSAAT